MSQAGRTISGKISTLLFLSHLSVFALVSLSFIITDFFGTYNEERERLETLAEAIGYNCCAALTFDDRSSAERILQTLKNVPAVRSAKISDGSGLEFAEYRPDIGVPNADRSTLSELTNALLPSTVEVHVSIFMENEIIGEIFIEAGITHIWSALLRKTAIATLIASLCAVLTAFGGVRLRNSIIKPVRSLVKSVEAVTNDGNYTVLVDKAGDDELGRLIEAFNTMLHEINLRDMKLQGYSTELERNIADRTNELRINNQLLEETLEKERAVSTELFDGARRASLQRSAVMKLVLDRSFVENELSAAVKCLAEVVACTADAARGSVWLFDDDASELRCLSLYETVNKTFDSGYILDVKKYPAYFRALESDKFIDAEDAQADPRTCEFTDDYLVPLGITSMLDVGIMIEGRLVGVICLEHIGPKRRWHPDEKSFAGTIAALAGQLMINDKRKQAEMSLQISEQRYRELHACLRDGLAAINMDGYIVECNASFLKILGGYSYDEVFRLTYKDITPERWHSMEDDIIRNQVDKYGYSELFEKEYICKDGSIIPVELQIYLVKPYLGDKSAYYAFIRDISERRRSENEREKLQQQLLQSQKMESVGRLAGGVAHDFNNMLGVILGHAELAMGKVDSVDPINEDLQEISDAAKRSAELTRQLLAFARKQTAAPVLLDLNSTVDGMLKMLKRLLGEDIDLVWVPGTDAMTVEIDPSQVDQILVNLCVNARDAIDGPGKITIETCSATFDDDYCTGHQGAVPGSYIMLAVSDNGCGMDKDLLSHLYEPFFTTKELGKGSGLGLATIYGIVKQNDGYINVYSEPGRGSTFKIYLPRRASKSELSSLKNEPKNTAACGGETILLVEDEPAILKMTQIMLKQRGYHVISASGPTEAIELAKECGSAVSLVITDVVMPEMNGRELVRRLQNECPTMKCLFMSGYTANVIAHHGVLDHGVNFIQKPFLIKDLLAKISEIINVIPN